MCLHAGNTVREVDGLCEAVAEWARGENEPARSVPGLQRRAESAQAKL